VTHGPKVKRITVTLNQDRLYSLEPRGERVPAVAETFRRVGQRIARLLVSHAATAVR
jgi:hypothetical protein